MFFVFSDLKKWTKKKTNAFTFLYVKRRIGKKERKIKETQFLFKNTLTVKKKRSTSTTTAKHPPP